MRNTVIGLAAAAAVITAGSTLSASACPYHHAYGGPGGEYGRAEYRRDFERHEYRRREFGRREYRREFEGRERPRREFDRGEYPRRSMVAASPVNAAAVVTTATERERQRYALYHQTLRHALAGESFGKWDAPQSNLMESPQ